MKKSDAMRMIEMIVESGHVSTIDLVLENLYTGILQGNIKLNEQDKKKLENIVKVAEEILKHEKKNTKTMYEYFITYEVIDRLGYSTNGKTYKSRSKKIDSAEDITELEKYIFDHYCSPMMKKVCITNFILLKEYEEEITDEEA